MIMKMAYSRREACDTLSIGLTKLHELINNHTLRAFKCGRKTLISGASIRDFVNGTEVGAPRQ